jgi:glycosyltransferase involved in cell wall biosynthesis
VTSERSEVADLVAHDDGAPGSALRLLIVSEGWTATQQISFVEGLARSRAAGEVRVLAVDEARLNRLGREQAQALFGRLFHDLAPTALVLSRYAGPLHRFLIAMARANGAKIICHLDDDLLEVPIALGAETYARYRHPRRLYALDYIIEQADVVYVSTDALAARLRRTAKPRHVVAAGICTGAYGLDRTGSVPPKPSGELRIGYMASATHAFDLEMIQPALTRLLAAHAGVCLHFFGSISKTAVARGFGARAAFTPRLSSGYGEFRRRLASMDWDIGLAPLRTDAFNLCKSATKWVEYADAGIAVAASAMPVYDFAGAAGAARLCQPDEWEEALNELVLDESLRQKLVAAARRLLDASFRWGHVEAQVLDLFRSAGAWSPVGRR